MHHDGSNSARARAARIRSAHHWEATELDAMERRGQPVPCTATRRRRLGRLGAILRPFRIARQA
jgi:hypothetical protein